MLDPRYASSVADAFVNGRHTGMLGRSLYRVGIEVIKQGGDRPEILVGNIETIISIVGTLHHIVAAKPVC
jgi:hypothetical protein